MAHQRGKVTQRAVTEPGLKPQQLSLAVLIMSARKRSARAQSAEIKLQISQVYHSQHFGVFFLCAYFIFQASLLKKQ